MQHGTPAERRATIARSVVPPAPAPLLDPGPEIARRVRETSVQRVAQSLDLSRWAVTALVAGTASRGTVALARAALALAAAEARHP